MIYLFRLLNSSIISFVHQETLFLSLSNSRPLSLKPCVILCPKLREMGAGTAMRHHDGPPNSDTKALESNDHVNSSLAGGMTIGPPIIGKQVT